jgi:hypothetical protein
VSTALSYQPVRKVALLWTWKRWVKVVCALLCFLTALGLWVLGTGAYYRHVDTPSVRVKLPYVSVVVDVNTRQWAGAQRGVHFVVFKDEGGMRWPAVEPMMPSHLEHGLGWIANVLGLMVVVLPTEYNGGDFIVAAHAALVVPYWVMLVGFGYLGLRFAGLWALVTPWRGWTRRSAAATVLMVLVFAVLNISPNHMESKFGRERFVGVADWLEITFSPPGGFESARLDYGFPFSALRLGFEHGALAWRGGDSGWDAGRVGDDLMLLFVAVMAVRLPLEWRGRRKRLGIAQAPAAVPL